MLLVRPVEMSDLESLAELVQLTRGAITTLPVDRDLLARRIYQSQASFAEESDRPGGELYTFVLEDTARPGHLLGTSSVVSKTGGFEPFYCYELREERYQSEVLSVDKLVRSLHLVEDHNGPTEIGGLFLRPGARGGGYGRLLSVSRFLFMASRPQAFEDEVIAEIRGVTDETGSSPFWDAVGRHFFGVTFAEADALSFKEKQVIADLMPDHPIYVDMLPAVARSVVGQEHDFARPARRLLESEGFEFKNRVDIFDAGPTLQCSFSDIRATKDSHSAKVSALVPAEDERADTLVCNERLAFRAAPAVVRPGPGGTVELSANAADVLEVRPGQTVRFVAIREAEAPSAKDVETFPSVPLPRET
jgi:arginine N-succinyltransferase